MPALPFFKFSPSGNSTILVPDMRLSLADRVLLAGRLMRRDHLYAEQVGFLDPQAEQPRLEMMGGELCLNACRAAAALLYACGRLTDALPFPVPLPDEAAGPGRQPLPSGPWQYGRIGSSGYPQPLFVRVRPLPGEALPTKGLPLEAALAVPCEAGVCLMPAGTPDVAVETVDAGRFLVRLPGITHLVLDARLHPVPEHGARAAALLRRELDLEQEQAVGCVWLCPGRPASIVPIVWVRATQETTLETACGSGSLACALHLLGGGGQVVLLQPGGDTLAVDLRPVPGGVLAWISGRVSCVACGTTFVDCP
jgi:hypothetical protein